MTLVRLSPNRTELSHFNGTTAHDRGCAPRRRLCSARRSASVCGAPTTEPGNDRSFNTTLSRAPGRVTTEAPCSSPWLTCESPFSERVWAAVVFADDWSTVPGGVVLGS